jgi:hypothetical protein
MYPYIHLIVGLVWSCDSESYAGGSVAIGRISTARQVKGDAKMHILVLQVGVDRPTP